VVLSNISLFIVQTPTLDEPGPNTLHSHLFITCFYFRKILHVYYIPKRCRRGTCSLFFRKGKMFFDSLPTLPILMVKKNEK